MKILRPHMQLRDERGSFLGVINEGQWEEINYVETEAGVTRGGHYHRETRELFLILEGEVILTIQGPQDGPVKSCSMKKGTVLIIEPGEVHTFKCKTRARWINVLSRRFDSRSPDLHRLPTIP